MPPELRHEGLVGSLPKFWLGKETYQQFGNICARACQYSILVTDRSVSYRRSNNNNKKNLTASQRQSDLI
jgi:hypothetical protein